MLRRTYPFAVACILLAVIGCTSMTSTMLTRDESNRFWTRKGPLKGVPITLKVPTHVQLTVFERHFLVKDKDGHVVRLALPYVVRDFSQEFIYTEKVFTVDFKRPASGTYNLGLELTDDQYIQHFRHDVTDTTIKDVTNLVTQLAPGGGGLRGLTASGEEEVDNHCEEIQSVVAVQIFEIDAPDFEDQVAAFISCHLNQAHDAWVAPPDVDTVHRVGISGFKEGSNVCEGVVVPNIKFHSPVPCEPAVLPAPAIATQTGSAPPAANPPVIPPPATPPPATPPPATPPPATPRPATPPANAPPTDAPPPAAPSMGTNSPTTGPNLAHGESVEWLPPRAASGRN
jgi:hypothetical protein